MHHGTVCRYVNLSNLIFLYARFLTCFLDHAVDRIHDRLLKLADPAVRMFIFISDPRQYIQAVTLLRVDHRRIGKLFSCLEIDQRRDYRRRADIYDNPIAVVISVSFKFRHITFGQHLMLSLLRKQLDLYIPRHLCHAGQTDPFRRLFRFQKTFFRGCQLGSAACAHSYLTFPADSLAVARVIYEYSGSQQGFQKILTLLACDPSSALPYLNLCHMAFCLLYLSIY